MRDDQITREKVHPPLREEKDQGETMEGADATIYAIER